MSFKVCQLFSIFVGRFFSVFMDRFFSIFMGGISLWGFTILLSCSPVGFEKDPNFNPCADVKGQDCVYNAEKNLLEYSLKVKSGMVDILFVVDNSGSMYTEQTRMGERFPNFLNRLSDLDYRIGITTTDVSASPNNGPREANGNGALQNGKLVTFPYGSKYLTPSSANIEYQFQNTVRRQETLICEQRNFASQYCPSFDERGIYAANLTLDKNPEGFIRKGAHLAVVILSDEDVRSRGIRPGQAIPSGFDGYVLQDYDLPETFFSRVKNQLGTDKTVSIHAVIVRPGDSTCLAQQVNGSLRGFEGKIYQEFADMADGKKDGQFQQGYVGSICAEDYGVQMGDIGSKIRDVSVPIQLACRPRDGSLNVSFSPPLPTALDYSIDDSLRLRFRNLIPKGYEIAVNYDCEVSN